MMTAGSLEPMLTRPLPVSFLLTSLALLAWPLYGDWMCSRAVDDAIE